MRSSTKVESAEASTPHEGDEPRAADAREAAQFVADRPGGPGGRARLAHRRQGDRAGGAISVRRIRNAGVTHLVREAVQQDAVPEGCLADPGGGRAVDADATAALVGDLGLVAA